MIKNTIFLFFIAFYAKSQPCHLVKDIHVGGSSATSTFAQMGDRVYFWATKENNERQMWSSDGNFSGTYPITNLEITTNGTSSAPLVINDSLLIFYSFTWPTGNELWRSDGNFEAETMIADLNPGSNGSLSLFGRSDGKYTYFLGGGGLQNDLYRTDGTAVGTILLKSGIKGFSNLVCMGGNAYFKVYFQGDTWLLKTNGTPSGTEIITKIQDQFVTTIPDNLVLFDGLLFFLKENDNESWGLWKTDGSISGTEMIVQLNPPNVGHPHSLTVTKNRLYFIANDGIDGSELRVSDGTQGGTYIVSDFSPIGASASINYMTALGKNLLFGCFDQDHGTELWISDGSFSGTHLLKDIEPGSISSSPEFVFSQYVHLDSLLFFTAFTADFGKELWQTDGTADGTFMVQDICPGPCDSSPSNLFAFPGHGIFFSAYSSDWGREPWIYDPFNTSFVKPHPEVPGKSFSIFPNPSNQNLINLEWSENISPSIVEIFDLHGRMLIYQKVEDVQKTSRLFLTELPTGMYFMKIRDASEKLIGAEKLVVQKN